MPYWDRMLLGAEKELVIRRLTKAMLKGLRKKLALAHDKITDLYQRVVLRADYRLLYSSSPEKLAELLIPLSFEEREKGGHNQEAITINDPYNGDYTSYVSYYEMQQQNTKVYEFIHPLLVAIAKHFAGEFDGYLTLRFPNQDRALAFLELLSCDPGMRAEKIGAAAISDESIAELLLQAPRNFLLNSAGVIMAPRIDLERQDEGKRLTERTANVINSLLPHENLSQEDLSRLFASPEKTERAVNALLTYLGGMVVDREIQSVRAALVMDRHTLPYLAEREQISQQQAEIVLWDTLAVKYNKLIAEEERLRQQILAEYGLRDAVLPGGGSLALINKEGPGLVGAAYAGMFAGSRRQRKDLPLSKKEFAEGLAIRRKTSPPLAHSSLLLLQTHEDGSCAVSFLPLHEDSFTSLSCEDLPIDLRTTLYRVTSLKLNASEKLAIINKALSKPPIAELDPLVAAARARCQMMSAAADGELGGMLFAKSGVQLAISPEEYDRLIDDNANVAIISTSRYGPGFCELLAGHKALARFPAGIRELLRVKDNETFKEGCGFGLVPIDVIVAEIQKDPSFVDLLQPLRAGRLRKESKRMLTVLRGYAQNNNLEELMGASKLLKGLPELRPYQERALQRSALAFTSKGGAILTMEVGTGKTVVALSAAEVVGRCLDAAW